MTGFIKICACVLLVQLILLNVAQCSPLGEINLKNTFDIGFKPLPFKPLAFIREKWSPYGMFGIRHGLVKRDLDSIQGAQKVTPMPMGMETRLPAPVYEDEPSEYISGRVPLSKEIIPIPAPPLPPVVLITPPPPKIKEEQPIQNGIFTDIGRAEMINAFLKSAERIPSNIPFIPEEKVLPPISNSIVPEKPKVEPPSVEKPESTNPFLRGSRFAISMGNILLDILTQFLNRTATGQEQSVPI